MVELKHKTERPVPESGDLLITQREYVYSVDGSGLRDKLTLLTHEVFHFDREAGEYIFSWDTTGQAPGEYEIRLSFGDEAGTTYDLRIRVN